MKKRNLAPVIEWAERNKELLDQFESDLLFMLHRQQVKDNFEKSCVKL